MMKKLIKTITSLMIILLITMPGMRAFADDADGFDRYDDGQKSDGSDLIADGSLELMDNSDDGVVTICIDPGHGGEDNGSELYNGGYEKNNNLKIALFLKDALEEYGTFRVVMTRTEDTGVSLEERAQIAADNNADLLFSVHTDYYWGGQASGISIFYPNDHYSQSISQAGYTAAVNVRYELTALGLGVFQGITAKNISEDDEDLLEEDGLRHFTYPATDADRANGIKIYDSSLIPGYRYTLGDYYGVIRNSKILGVPAIIVEHGFGNNAGDYNAYMSDDAKLKKLAEADARAIATTYGFEQNGIIQLEDGNRYYFKQGVVQTDYTGFVQDGSNSWYVRNGIVDSNVSSSVKNGWQKIGGIWYYRLASGKMAVGWQKISGKWYYFHSTCAMATGWAFDGSAWYFLKDSGEMATGWLNRGGFWYYLNSSGAMATGWKKVDGTWYYFKSSGEMATGWVLDGNTWYFLKDSGAMATGWLNRGGTWYYLNSSGAMAVGWKKVDGTWYYFRNSGAMATGWVLDGNDWYFLKSSGAMATGWLNRGGTWYYLNSSGAMAVGWKKVDGIWYYFRDSGAMATGWLQDGNEWYYLDSSGAMATGNRAIGGKSYYFNSSGVLVE